MNKFLITLIKEGKVKLVAPSENIYESYIKKSNDSLKSANLLHKSKLYDNSVSMSYYAMYHITLALFFKTGIKCENHTGAIILLKDIFLEPELSDKIKSAKKERVDKQYYADHKTLEEDSVKMIEISKEFANRIRIISENINNSFIAQVRNKLKTFM